MKKTKVLQFIHGFSMGGAETLVKEYCLKLNKEKYDLTVLCFHRYDTPYEKILEDAGIRVIYASDHIRNYDKIAFQYPGRIIMLLKRWMFLRDCLRKEAPDVLHFHMALSAYVLLAGLDKKVKMFRTIHNEPKKRWDHSFGRRLDFYTTKRLVKKYHLRFITLHEQMRREVNELFGVNDSLVLNNGIDFSRFEKTEPREKIRAELGIPQNAFVIGHVGRFNVQKNHEFLVRIFAEICKRNPNTYLLLIGKGSLRGQIEEQLKQLGLEDRYQILSDRMDIPDLMNCMDKFVFPSRYEGLGIVLIEAQKVGLECVISQTVPDAAIVSNLVEKIELCEPVEVWAEKILSFHVEEIRYHKIEEWDMERVVCRLEEMYDG